MSPAQPSTTKLQSPLLSEVLFDQQTNSFSNIAPYSFNIEALEASLMFSAGLTNFVAVVGPSGWGKSHMLSAVQTRFRNDGRNSYPILPASKLVSDQNHFTGQSPLLVDDCQEIVELNRSRVLARITLETRIRAQKPTFLSFTGARLSRSMRALIPNPREWKICQIEEPSLQERLELIKYMAKADGLNLSHYLIRILAGEMHGNGRTITGALKRLRLSGGHWTDNRATVHACGILDAFFADNSSWDLKHRILKAVAEQRRHTSDKGHFPDIAAYVMLKVACLNEIDAARSLGVEPAEAYFSASRFESDLESSTPKMIAISSLLESLVRTLSKEA